MERIVKEGSEKQVKGGKDSEERKAVKEVKEGSEKELKGGKDSEGRKCSE